MLTVAPSNIKTSSKILNLATGMRFVYRARTRLSIVSELGHKASLETMAATFRQQ
jgi:hypothetical protein